MRRRQGGTGMLLLMLLTGCPSEFGKDGRINKAVHQDSQERLELVRKHCNEREYKQFCGGNKKYTLECRDECGG